ncbi:MAG TPA: HEAT repeat domain-containing protein [Gemmatimonadaceae bacterium]|nr:HEAT repeat domain-containing protein [Gemmatimonadaceae bacterium]
MRPFFFAFAATLAPLAMAPLGAQSLASRVVEHDGSVEVIFPSRPEACGDGRSFISHVFGNRNDFGDRPCVHGPARVEVTVMDGEVTRLRSFVGPVPPSANRTITASAADAGAWLTQVVNGASARVAQEAVVPLVLVDEFEPWDVLLRVSRDDARPLAVRRAALNWVGFDVNHHLGLDDASADSEDDEMRRQAVFVLSQRAKRDGTAELIDAARTSRHPSVRRDAIFWLSQVGEPTAVANLYADLLKSR